MSSKSPSGSKQAVTFTYVATVGAGILIGAVAYKYFSKYQPPDVWKHIPQGGTFGSINRPTAGARVTKALPKGDHPLQLYSLGTANGRKVTCLLEELSLMYGLEYDGWMISIMNGDQFTSGFVEVNPNSKIPALLDYNTKSGKPTRVFESASILMYLCETYDTKNLFLPPVGSKERTECLNWLFWVQGSAPYLGGGFGHFYKYAPVKIQYAIDRFSMEVKRELDVLEKHFRKSGHLFLCGDEPTIADFCCFPWYGNLVEGQTYNAAEFLSVYEYPTVIAWSKRMRARKGVKRGMIVNKSIGEGVKLKERHSSKDFEALESKL